VCLGSVCETLLIGGTASFGAKIIQEFFNVDLATAGTIMGILSLFKQFILLAPKYLNYLSFKSFDFERT
jgi:hypothetical protein